MADKVKSILNNMTEPMVMKVSNDRVRTRPDYVPDTAETGGGVFALLEDDELSDAEKARMNRGESERAAKAEAKMKGVPYDPNPPKKRWAPAAIFNRVIEMYRRLTPVKGEK